MKLPPIGECDPATDIEYCAFLPLLEKIHATPGKEAEVFASLSIGQRALYATRALEHVRFVSDEGAPSGTR